MNSTTEAAWLDSITRNIAGLRFFSVGDCQACSECNPGRLDDAEYDRNRPEAHFSHFRCESCGVWLAGDCHAAHAYIGEDLTHLEVCGDCLLFHANGDLPDFPDGEEG